jgi:hypothetical protein
LHSLLAGSVLLALAGVADAQALFLARRAIGRIEQMSQSSPTTGAAYDTAVVIVEVAPGPGLRYHQAPAGPEHGSPGDRQR